MKLSLNWLGLLAIAVFVLNFSSCDDDDGIVSSPSITEFVQNNDNFSSLFAAVERANLGAALGDESASLTVFAPTNAAFATFLSENNFASLDDVPVDLLTNVLLGHVIGSEVRSSALANGYQNTLATFDGQTGENISIYINTDNNVTVNGSVSVTAVDEDASNGVIHVVDAVIMPADVVTLAATNASMFSSLVAALTREDLDTDFVEILSGDGPFTVFAPTNAAFQALLDSNESWTTLTDIPVETLDAVLKYHVIAGANVRSGDISDGQTVNTLNGATFTIDLGGNDPVINAGSNSANIIALDVQGSNGVVHAIDAVLLP